jgi:uncharacterized membrane protein
LVNADSPTLETRLLPHGSGSIPKPPSRNRKFMEQTYRIAARENRQKLVKGLGWFSIGLGLFEIVAPRTLSRLIGVKPHTGVMRLFGVREVISGLGILSQPESATWLDARVAGDAMDLALLGGSFFSERSHRGRLALATAAVAGVTAVDILCSKDLKEGPGTQSTLAPAQPGAVSLRRSIIVNRPASELYQMWRNLEGLPKFMSHLLSVKNGEGNRSRWVARGPGASRIEWDAQIEEERLHEMISWRSLPNADVESTGSVRFEPATGGRGTVVRVEMHYRPPAGKAGALVAKLLGQSPEKQIAVDLLRFKQMAETGEIARTEGQPAGRNRSTSRKYDDLIRA